MRYYNENPQVTHWMGKCATLQQELDMLQERHKELVGLNKNLIPMFQNLIDKIEKFNSLPWYKKMFYRFNL